MISAGADASCTSATSISRGPTPARAYAISAARAATTGSEPSGRAVALADDSTRIGCAESFDAIASLTRTAAAAPSPIGEHIGKVSGSLTILLARTSVTVVSIRNCAFGLNEAAWRLL